MLKVGMRNSQIGQTARYMAKYFMYINEITMSCDDPGVGSQAYQLSRLIPLQAAVENRIQDVSLMRRERITVKTEMSIVEEVLYDEEFQTFPDMDRISPDRKAVRLAGSTAWVVKEVARK